MPTWLGYPTAEELAAEAAKKAAAEKAAAEKAAAEKEARWGRVKRSDGLTPERRAQIHKERETRHQAPEYMRQEAERLAAEQAEQVKISALAIQQKVEAEKHAAEKLKMTYARYQQLQADRAKRAETQAKTEQQLRAQYDAAVDKTHAELRASKQKAFAVKFPNDITVVSKKDPDLASGSRDRVEVRAIHRKMKEAQKWQYTGMMGLFKKPTVDPGTVLETSQELRK